MTPVEQRLQLDALEGPALRLSLEDEDALAASIVDDWVGERAATDLARPTSAGWAAAAGLVVGFVLAGGLAAALFVIARPDPAPAPSFPRQAPAPAPVTPPVEAPAPEAVEEAEPTVEAPEEARPARRETPRDLLARANGLRGEREYARAAALYARVGRGRGAEAYAGSVAAGELELEHLGHPARAARHFSRAIELSPRGPLDLSARQGLAQALRRSGATAAERRALEALIAVHPDSGAASRARARLSELDE